MGIKFFWCVVNILLQIEKSPQYVLVQTMIRTIYNSWSNHFTFGDHISKTENMRLLFSPIFIHL